MKKKDLEILVDLQEEYIADLEDDIAMLDACNNQLLNSLGASNYTLNGGVEVVEYPAPTNSIPDFPEIGIIIGGISGLLIGIGLVALLKALL
jgi:hypothetical protein